MVITEELEEDIAHDHICMLSKPASLQSSELPVVYWEGKVSSQIEENYNSLLVTRFHEMSLNLKFGNLRYQHVSNLQVLLVVLILKSCFYSKEMWIWRVSEGCMCGRGHFEKISFKVFTVQWVVFLLILSNRRFKCINLYQFWHRNISNIGAHEETWNFNIS